MKLYFQYIVILFFSLGLWSCVDEDTPDYGQTDVTRVDPYSDLLVNTPIVSFVAGEPGYDIEFLVITPGSDDVTKVNVYKTFTDASTGAVSDRVLLKGYDVPAGNSAKISDNITFADLREGIVVNGTPLTDDEVAIPVGSKWDLSFEPVNSAEAEVFASSKGIIVGVLSPFAGLYKVTASNYFRIGADSGNWDGEERFIGSVDENTFSYNDHWGPFASTGFFVFDINADNTISVLDDPSQLFFSGDDMLTCQEDGAAFVSVPCEGSNILEPKADGRHVIKLTYGYFTITGDENEGAREFYEVLEKIVE